MDLTTVSSNELRFTSAKMPCGSSAPTAGNELKSALRGIKRLIEGGLSVKKEKRDYMYIPNQFDSYE
ncbi:hypothetical protein TNCV_4731121 [Trichonephila clavipes]|nr:hypothetical protein TNCV_4731121 [Trichonephila clavipes]